MGSWSSGYDITFTGWRSPVRTNGYAQLLAKLARTEDFA